MASGRRTTEVAEDAAATSVIDAGPAEADAEPDVAGQTVVVAKEPSAAGPPKPQSRDISPDAYLVFRCIATVAALWMCHRGLSAEIPAGVDIGGHVVRTEYAFDLFGQGRLDGWFPGFGSGYRLFGVNGPGLSLASGLVRTVMLGSVTTARSFALLGGLAFAALPWAVAALSRSLGSSRLAASIHGVLALAVSFYGGGGLAGLYEIGLIAQAVALPLQVVALAAVVRAVRDGGRRHLAVAALLVGVLGLLHPISILVVVVLVPFLTGHEVLRTPTRWAGRLTLVGMWAAAVAGYWLLPAIRLRDLRGGVTGWGIPPLPTRLGDIVGGHDLLPRAIAVAALVALVVVTVRAVRRPDLRYRLRLPIAALAFLIVAHYAYGHGIGPYEVVSLLPTRGLALMGVLLLQPLAEVLADVANVLRRRWAAAGGLVVVGCAICVPWLVSGRLDPPQVAEPATGSFLDAAAYLEQAVPPMGRHLMVNPPNSGVTGTGHAVRWMAAASGTNSAHLYLWEATRENAAGVIANDLLATVEPADAAGQLRRLGVTHVVVASLDQANRLAAADGAF